jgi:hemolysin type calcium-binding protein
VFAIALMLGPASAHAATITVDSAADNTSNCTLRNAITAANTNAAQGSCSPGDPAPAIDVIDFSIPTPATITLGSALPDIMSDVTITGPGMNQLTIDGADSYRPITTFSGTTISISGMTITNGFCDDTCGPSGANGGAIHTAANLTLTDVALTNNTVSADGGGAQATVSAEGGAIRNLGQLTIVQSKLTGNTAEATGATSQASAYGGGIINYGTLTLDRATLDSNTAAASLSGSNTNPNGGAIMNFGTLTISRSTVSNNTASGTGAPDGSNGASGGAINNSNDATNVNIDIDRSTISGNTATTPEGNGQGGGIEVFGAASSQITSSTIAHNTADSGSNLVAFAETHLKNTIVSNPGGPDNCLGSPTSDGYNLTDTTCSFTGTGDQQNADPMLQALAANGGPTKTHALKDGSDAIDQGLSSLGETVDQRGQPRPVNYPGIANPAGGDGTDVGAFELQLADRPQTIIDSGPAGTTHDPSPTFTFHSPDAASTFQCKVDAGAFGVCTSPKTTTPLADGSHTFTVRAQDAAMNVDPTPASRSFTVKTATISRSGSALIITATAGTKDNVRISRPSPSTIRISDAPSGAYSGSGIHGAPGSGCTRVNDYVADCNAAGVTSVTANGGGLTDKLANLAQLPGKLLGGPAADILTGGPVNDTLNGGSGADSFRGMNGNDVLLARDLASDTLINCDGGTAPGTADKAILDALPKDPASIVYGCETKTRP